MGIPTAIGPSKDHSTKRERSRTRLQLVLRQNGYWKTNCFVMEVERSSCVHSPSSPRGESSLPYLNFRFVCAPVFARPSSIRVTNSEQETVTITGQSDTYPRLNFQSLHALPRLGFRS